MLCVVSNYVTLLHTLMSILRFFNVWFKVFWLLVFIITLRCFCFYVTLNECFTNN